jgi:hypothetical protein|tara:strand:+ start:391 stop:618 length:228 start_codon:yes stop_codon:yes gene_type:complete
MSKKADALLYRMSVSITSSGDIALDFEGPPSAKDIENIFDKWNPEFEHTKKIVSLVNYLRDYSDQQYRDFKGIIY